MLTISGRQWLRGSGRQWLRALLAATCIRGCLQPRVLSRPVTPHTSSVWPRNVCTLSSLCKASRVASSHLGFNESVSLIRKEKACVTCSRQLNRASVATAHLLPCISTAAGDVSCRANSVALLSILRRTRCWAAGGGNPRGEVRILGRRCVLRPWQCKRQARQTKAAAHSAWRLSWRRRNRRRRPPEAGRFQTA